MGLFKCGSCDSLSSFLLGKLLSSFSSRSCLKSAASQGHPRDYMTGITHLKEDGAPEVRGRQFIASALALRMTVGGVLVSPVRSAFLLSLTASALPTPSVMLCVGLEIEKISGLTIRMSMSSGSNPLL